MTCESRQLDFLGVLLFPIGAVYAQQPPPQVAAAAASTSATTPAASSPAPSIPKSSAPPRCFPYIHWECAKQRRKLCVAGCASRLLAASNSLAQAPLVVSPEAAPRLHLLPQALRRLPRLCLLPCLLISSSSLTGATCTRAETEWLDFQLA